jgi:uncharacterized membrane protein
MKIYVLSYLAAGIVMLGIDAVWLGVMGSAFYRPMLGDMLQEKFSPAPAAIFYLLYVAGIVIFGVTPAFESGRWTTALTHGALLGFFAYATYDLTNQATLRHWPTLVTIVDLSWGTTLTGVSATLGYLIARTVAGWLGE